MNLSPAKILSNHAGEVFGYRNLYTVDAAIIPESHRCESVADDWGAGGTRGADH